jgi:hypothetical protein
MVSLYLQRTSGTPRSVRLKPSASIRLSRFQRGKVGRRHAAAEALEITETSSNGNGQVARLAPSPVLQGWPLQTRRLDSPPEMATPIRVSLGFMAWLQDVWSGFATGGVYTGDVTAG